MDYKQIYSTPDGRVKVLPTISSAPTPTESQPKMRNVNANNTNIIANNSVSGGNQSVPNKMFRLPPPPPKSSIVPFKTNKTNKDMWPVKQFETQENSSKHMNGNAETVSDNLSRKISRPSVPVKKSLETTSSLKSESVSLGAPSSLHNKETPNCDMKKLQFELEQLKKELAAMAEPMKEHDEWLKIQSEQVKELVQQQKQLETNINLNSGQEPTFKNDSGKHFNSLPPLPTSPRPNMKMERALPVAPKPYVQKNQASVKERQEDASPINRINTIKTAMENRKASPNTRKERTNATGTVKRLSGIFEATLMANRNDIHEHKSLEHPKKQNIERRFAAEGNVVKVVPPEYNKNEHSIHKTLVRSKSMYSTKPPPTPKPVRHQKPIFFPSMLGEYEEIRKEQSNASFTESDSKPQVIRNSGLGQDTRNTNPETLSAVSAHIDNMPKDRTIPFPTSTDTGHKILNKTASNEHHNSPISRGQTNTLETESMTKIRTDLTSSPPQSVIDPDQSSVHEVQRSDSPPSSPLPPVSFNSNKTSKPPITSIGPPPPPPPLPPTSLNSPKLGNSDQFDTATDSDSTSSSHTFNYASQNHYSRSFSVPNITDNGMSKAQLLQQIREFGNSGCTLKKAPPKESDGGTPQSLRKHEMHDALQTRFQAFCGSESDSSADDDVDEDYDWDE